MRSRTLHVGDAADTLAAFPDGVVHLCYLDPPYYTRKDWGQFDDRWADRAEFVAAMRMIAEQVHRVLVPGGALYWQGDDNAIHVIWAMLEEVFGCPVRRSIAWAGSTESGFKSAARNWVRSHDTILYFVKGKAQAFNTQRDPHTAARNSRYNLVDDEGRHYKVYARDGRRYYRDKNPGRPAGSVWEPHAFNKQFEEHTKGRMDWYRKVDEDGRRYKVVQGGRKVYADTTEGKPVGSVWEPHAFNPQYRPYNEARIARFNKTDETGRRYQQLHHPGRDDRQYLDESKGHLEGTVWRDFFVPTDPERTGYPTQKPTALLDRIIRASSNEGDLVLDPCCGSGTTLVAAERLARRWVGIDRNPEAVKVAERRVRAEVERGALLDEGPEVRVELEGIEPSSSAVPQ